jgi:cytochrome c-type biogenesis protein CcmH
MNRREFFTAAASVAAASVAGAGVLGAQQARPTMSGPMDENAYHPVSRPPKPDARPSMSDDARDALEHRLHCQCGCTLDVYTCRTTDFTCPVSPAMHHDVMALVTGGYSADEILETFRAAYGDKVLMAPPRQGFNWAGYVLPSAVLAAGGVIIAVLIQRWRTITAAPAAAPPPIDATSDELRRLEEAVRRDG